MSLPRPSVLLSLVLVLLAGCGPATSETPSLGAMRLTVSLPLAVPGDVSRVTVTVSAPDIDSRSLNLVLTDGAWSGTLGEIPAGASRTFVAQAFTSANTLRYEGRVENVTVTAGVTGLLAITLQDVSPEAPFINEAPLIDSLLASASTVSPGGSLTLSATAHDPNAGDTVSYVWTATAGSFSSPTQASTTWTAPSAQGPVTLTLTVSDSRGASLSVTLLVNVVLTNGAEEVKISFNSAPRVGTLSSTQSFLDIGQQTALTISATDADADSLSYQWSATCAGSFSGATSASTAFTPSALPSAPCNNCQLSVTVRDGRGAQNTGSVALCVAKAPAWRAPARWLPTASLAMKRSAHTATLLSNGKVLVVGGDSAAGDQRTAELYDPATGTWSATGSMTTERSSHTATLLANGKVFVLWGYGNMKAELYDPATGTWSATGAMIAPRRLYTATLLSNGKVLVAGGDTSGSILATAEVYDPATGTFSSTGAMGTARINHQATLLSNGKVLVSGGFNLTNKYLATAELYDPATGTWSATGAMGTTRSYPMAELLTDGKVLVSGGHYVNSSSTTIRLATAELYDPATGTWRATGSMASAHPEASTTRLADGKVFVCGGLLPNGNTLSLTTEVYNPATATWSSSAALPTGRFSHTATLLSNGRVLVSGGATFADHLAKAELYDPMPSL